MRDVLIVRGGLGSGAAFAAGRGGGAGRSGGGGQIPRGVGLRRGGGGSLGRGLGDRRLWLSGLAAIGAFFVATPYTFLDFAVFAGHFSTEVEHMRQGHGQEMGWGWWYHLRVSFPDGLGWLGSALALVGAVLAWRCKEGRVLLAAFVGYYLVMGAGQLVFVRYALPLLVLGAVLASGAVARVGSPGATPCSWRGWSSRSTARWRIAQLQAGGYTRSAAMGGDHATSGCDLLQFRRMGGGCAVADGRGVVGEDLAL